MSSEGSGGPRWDQESLIAMSRAFMESRVLLTGAELDLFSAAAEPADAAQIAGRVGADPRALAVLLDALSAMGLLVKRGKTYETEPSAAPLLTSASPHSILPMIQHAVTLWDRWGGLTGRVGGARAQGMSERAFIQAMHLIATPLASRIVTLVDPGEARKLIDVGGGQGTYTLAFLRAFPDLRATLFDLPHVVEMAREMLGAAGVLDRVDLVAGDFYENALPGGHDLAFVSAIIHQNSAEENVEMLRKIFGALEPGGRIVLRDHVLSPDRTQPKTGALFAVNMLAGTEGGNSYTESEIRGFLERAGFERTQLIHPDTRMDGLVEAFKPS